MKLKGFEHIYYPCENKTMSIVFFVSGSGGNLNAALELQDKEKNLFKIELIISDRPNVKSIEIARSYNIPFKIYDFKSYCGDSPIVNNHVNTDKYWKKSENLHDKIYEDILLFEKTQGLKFGLAVLTYRRIIKGKLLNYFRDKMINQHPGDLSIKDTNGKRKYVGMTSVKLSLKDNLKTRTSTIMVRESMDSGEILCQGPWVANNISGELDEYQILIHEKTQKIKSDWPSIKFAIEGIARGFFQLSENINNEEGLKQVAYRNNILPLKGVDLH